jgi:sporulation related protein
VASSGDRGLIWSGLESYNILCRSERDVGGNRTSELIQDLQTINLPPHQLVVFESDREAPAAIVEKYEFQSRRSSSAIFRVVAIGMAALLVGLIIWWIGLWLGNDAVPETSLPVVEEAAVGRQTNDGPADTAAVDTTQIVVDESVDEADVVYADDDPFNQPVGEAGYCLHVYSLVDSMLAEQQLDEMAARGVSGLIHSSVVDGRTWYRVYTGSFASVAECRAAMPEIFERLEIDWAMPASSRRIAQQ